ENNNFYFLEMNTRLQVEHPITEEVTGIDIVKQQIKIAYGESISFNQDDIKLNGHAMEVRIYAEDTKTLFPSPGKIESISVIKGEGIRHEKGIVEGYTVSPYYDPMVAKLIVHSENRETTRLKLINVLKEYKVKGIKTNIPLI